MASELSRIPRTKEELKHFLENNKEEYYQAYKNIKPGEGWRIEFFEREIYSLMDTLYLELYDMLYPKLSEEYSVPDQEIIDNILALESWTKQENALFERITKANGHGVLINIEATVQELLIKAYYKFSEAAILAKEERMQNKHYIKPKPLVADKTDYLIGIITATPEEFNSVKVLLSKRMIVSLRPEDSHHYTKGYFERGEKSLAIVLTQTQDQGSSAAAVATTQMINSHNPDFLVMLGHAAGNKNLMRTTHLGDILIAKEAYDYGQLTISEKNIDGKVQYIEKNKKRPVEADRTLVNLLTQFSIDEAMLEGIKDKYSKHDLFPDKLAGHVGSIASGNAMVRSESWFNKIVAENAGTVGMDMECYGFYFAAQNSRFKNKPLFIAIKSVSDFGSHNTTYPPELTAPLYRINYATHTSANFFLEFALTYLPI